MAAAFFNSMADPLKARAISAGTNPAKQVHPDVMEAMKEVGIDLSSAIPQKLTEELAAGVNLLVTMGCGEACPFIPGLKRVDWPLQDPKGQPISTIRNIREQIRERVVQLVSDEGWG